jgi:hypothetical protein
LSKVSQLNNLVSLSQELVHHWCDGLLAHQIVGFKSPGLFGGIMSPAYARVEGRCGDAVYPLMFMAGKTGDQRYLDGAVRVMQWSENNVFFPDGSVVNDVSVSDWRGITVQSAICLAEALLHYSFLLDEHIRQRWTTRLNLTANYLYETITIDFANINYPACCSYAMVLLGHVLDDKKYTTRGQELAHQVLPYFTAKDKLLYGEGKPRHATSPKGCLTMDIGYNVEESLPALVLYAVHQNDATVREMLIESLKSHLQFMLPDGAWDNSMGTRNYKWTYWGTRNAEGCQPAYALLADRDPAFLEAAYRNARLLKECTHDGLLYAGPHNFTHGELPSVHHTFCHAKALATILDIGIPEPPVKTDRIPRDLEKGVIEMLDMQTWLISKGPWRATITGYDQLYIPNSHASGGALTLLWHEKVGPVCASSTTDYKLIEPTNMQMDKDPHSMSLTPRLEFRSDGRRFSNIQDAAAVIDWHERDGGITVKSTGSLVDGGQKSPNGLKAEFKVHYFFDKDLCQIMAEVDMEKKSGELLFILPIISENFEKITRASNKKIIVKKQGGDVTIRANQKIDILPTNDTGRVFNFVPGMEALPLAVTLEPDQTKPLVLLISVSE